MFRFVFLSALVLPVGVLWFVVHTEWTESWAVLVGTTSLCAGLAYLVPQQVDPHVIRYTIAPLCALDLVGVTYRSSIPCAGLAYLVPQQVEPYFILLLPFAVLI